MTTEENMTPNCSDEEWHQICDKIFDRGDRTKALAQLVKCDEYYDGGLTHRNGYRHQRDIGAKKPNPECVMVFQKVENIEPHEGGN